MKKLLPLIFGVLFLSIAGESFAATAGVYVGGGRAVLYVSDGNYQAQINCPSASGLSGSLDTAENILQGSSYEPHSFTITLNNALPSLTGWQLTVCQLLSQFYSSSDTSDCYAWLQTYISKCNAAGKTPGNASLAEYLNNNCSFPPPTSNPTTNPTTNPVDSDGDGIPDSEDPTPNGEPGSQPSSTSSPSDLDWSGEPESQPVDFEKKDLKDTFEKLNFKEKLELIRNGGSTGSTWDIRFRVFSPSNPTGGQEIGKFAWDFKPSNSGDFVGGGYLEIFLYALRAFIMILLFYRFIKAIYNTLTRA